MRWTIDEKRLLRQLFLDEKLPIADIARRMGRTTASINDGLTTFRIPRQRSVPKLHMPTSMTPTLARIHAHVCGDGHLFISRERDHYGYLAAYRQGYYRHRYGFGYTNTKPKLIQSFMQDVRDVFGLTPRYDPKRWQVTVRSKRAWEFLSSLGAGKSRTWRVPSEITRASEEVAAAWIKAFFDDEAHFVPRGGIRVRSVNRPGLEQTASMLRRFVPCHLTPAKGLYPDESCYLVVPAAFRAQFMRMIGSTKLTGRESHLIQYPRDASRPFYQAMASLIGAGHHRPRAWGRGALGAL